MSPEELAALSDDELLARIAQLRDRIDGLRVLYAERTELFREGRRRVPPIKTKVLGEAAGVSDVAVTQAVKP